MSDEQSCVGLKTTWKPNLRFLFLVATILAPAFCLRSKMMTADLLTFVVGGYSQISRSRASN
jgi:hypothetical protein